MQGIAPDQPGWWESLLRIMVHVQPIGACIEISFHQAPPSPAPYRITNRSPYLVSARQKGVEGRVHLVQPNSQAPYAWAETSLEHTLLITLAAPNDDSGARSSIQQVREGGSARLGGSLGAGGTGSIHPSRRPHPSWWLPSLTHRCVSTR